MTPTRKNDVKIKILQQHSALNPRPDGVKGEFFAEYEFFDPYDTVQVKYEMLRCVQKDGWSVSLSAKTFGFSRSAFYQAQTAFQRAGLWGLFRNRPGPRRAHKFSNEVVDFIENALEDNESLSAVDICQLIKEKFGISVHRRSVERTLKHRQKKG